MDTTLLSLFLNVLLGISGLGDNDSTVNLARVLFKEYLTTYYVLHTIEDSRNTNVNKAES